MRAAGRAAKDIRRHNRAMVLELIRTQGPVSRGELARMARLSTMTINEIAGRLQQEGLVRDAGEGPSTGGRPPSLLELDPDARNAIGLEIGPRTITAVVTNLEAEVSLRVEAPSKMFEGPAATTDQVEKVLEEIGSGMQGQVSRSLGVGVALPAPIFASSNDLFTPPSYPEWGTLNVPELITGRLGLEVIVDNDANARALGELLFGAGRGASDMFYVLAHWGIGGAVVLDGDLRRGAGGGSGEIGHTIVEIGGPRCGCGGYGCLEAFAGRAAIVRRARRALMLSGRDRLMGIQVDELKVRHVLKAALEGDELAMRVMEETGEYLGIGIANTLNFLNPEIVVLGGSTMQVGDLVLGAVERVARARALLRAGERVKIVRGELGEDAGAVGAAALVLRELLTVSVPG